MRNNAEQRPALPAGEPTRRARPDTYFAPPVTAKSDHALQSPASKLGSILILLAICSVAAVGVFLPSEDEARVPLSSGVQPRTNLTASEMLLLSQTSGTSNDPAQQAYTLAHELARLRVKTVSGLTREQRIETGREAIVHVLGGDLARLDPATMVNLAKVAPLPVKKAAFRGVNKGEAMGISAQSQLLVERMLSAENRDESDRTSP